MAEPKFQVEAPDEYFETFVALEAGHQRRVRKLLEHVQQTPTAPYPGLKQLHGEYRGTWQFLVSASDGVRLHYTVDEVHRSSGSSA